MDKIEEVKRILIDNTHIHYEEFGNSGKIPISDLNINKATREICKLFPKTQDNPAGHKVKPNEGRLLTDV